MIFTIAKNELRGMLRERRFQVAALVLSILFGVSLLGTRAYYLSLQNEIQAAEQAARKHWETQDAKNPHSAAHYGTFIFKPAYPLSYFDRGIDFYTGNTLFIEGHRMNEAQHRSAMDRSEFARLGVLTPAFVLGILFPLFIIILGFGAISGEREHGNLRMLMAQGLRGTTLFWGKALGLWGATSMLALPFLALGVWGLFLPGTTSEHWIRYALMACVWLLCLGCFIHLTLLISSWAKQQSVALIACLGAWIFICLIVPKAAVNLARWKHPTPSLLAYQQAVKEDLEKGVDGHAPADEHAKKLEQETLAQYGVETVDKLPFNWDGFIMQKGEEHETFVFQKHKNALFQIYQQQQNIQAAVALCSPYLLASITSQQVAQTDIHTYHGFLAAAERYRIQLVGELNADLTHNFKYGDWGSTRDETFFSKNAKFDFKPEPLQASFPRLSKVLLVLIAWLLASGGAAILTFRKLKPV